MLFHHYPEFDQERGDVGDTIVWDSHSDRLIIQDDEEDYHALCYREVESNHVALIILWISFSLLILTFKSATIVGATILGMSATMLVIVPTGIVLVTHNLMEHSVKLSVSNSTSQTFLSIIVHLCSSCSI